MLSCTFNLEGIHCIKCKEKRCSICKALQGLVEDVKERVLLKGTASADTQTVVAGKNLYYDADSECTVHHKGGLFLRKNVKHKWLYFLIFFPYISVFLYNMFPLFFMFSKNVFLLCLTLYFLMICSFSHFARH